MAGVASKRDRWARLAAWASLTTIAMLPLAPAAVFVLLPLLVVLGSSGGGHRPRQVGLVVGVATMTFVPYAFFARVPDAPVRLPPASVFRQVALLNGSALSTWSRPPQPTDPASLVGHVAITPDRTAECVRLAPAPQSYVVAYMPWFTGNDALTARLSVRAFGDEPIGARVLVRLRGVAAGGDATAPGAAVEWLGPLDTTWHEVELHVPAAVGSGDAAPGVSSLAVVNPSGASPLTVCVADARVTAGDDRSGLLVAGDVRLPPTSLPHRIATLVAAAILALAAFFGVMGLRRTCDLVGRNSVGAAAFVGLAVTCSLAIVEAAVAWSGGAPIRVQGGLPHPNLFGAAALAYAFAVASWNKDARVLAGSVVLAAIVALLSGSRTAAIGLVVWSVGTALTRHHGQRGRPRFSWSTLGAVGAAAAFAWVVQQRSGLLSPGRADAMWAALEVVTANPLGVGMGLSGPLISALIAPETGLVVAHAHSVPLGAAVELGLVTTACIAVLGGGTLWRYRRHVVAPMASLAAAVVAMGLLDVTITHPAVYVPIVLAVIGLLPDRGRTGPDTDPPPPRPQ